MEPLLGLRSSPLLARLGFSLLVTLLHAGVTIVSCAQLTPPRVQSWQDLLNDGIPKHIGNLERLLGDKEFYLGSTFSLADICVYDCVVNFYETSVPEMFAGGKYPRIQALCKRVAERPGIKEYLASDACAAIDRMTPL
jgi:glutathione S-transferase